VDATDFVANRSVATMNARFVVGIFSPAQAPPRTAGQDTIHFGVPGITMMSVVLGSMRPTRDIVCQNICFVTADGVHIYNIENAWSCFKRIRSGSSESSGLLQLDLDELCYRWSFCGGTIKNRSFFFAKLVQPSDWCAAEKVGGAPFTGQTFSLRSS
jgi:hypothetical protein